MNQRITLVLCCIFCFLLSSQLISQQCSMFQWKHLSTAKGDLPVPNTGTEQTSSVVCDIDKDGVNDFAIGERTMAPAVVWYRRTSDGWEVPRLDIWINEGENDE